MPIIPSPPTTIAQYEALSRGVMPSKQFELLFGTYGDPEWPTYNNNISGFRTMCLRPRVLVDVSQRSLSTEVLGQKVALPVLLAPQVRRPTRILMASSPPLGLQALLEH